MGGCARDVAQHPNHFERADVQYQSRQDQQLGAGHRSCEGDELVGVAGMRHRKVRHQQVMVLGIRNFHPDRGTAHVALMVGAPGSVGIRETDTGLIFGARLQIADPERRRYVRQDPELRVVDAEHAFGMKCALNVADLGRLLVLELDIEDVPGELRKGQPLCFGAAARIALLPIFLRHFSTSLPTEPYTPEGIWCKISAT